MDSCTAVGTGIKRDKLKAKKCNSVIVFQWTRRTIRKEKQRIRWYYNECDNITKS